MRRKWICVLLAAAVLMGSAALARPDDGLFETGKKAMALLSYGEYGRALSLLGIAGVSEEDFARQIEDEFRALFRGTVQTEVAVMFRENRDWFLAVPVTEPDEDQVETMVFALGDGSGFTGVEQSRWGDVMDRVDECPECFWDQEYTKSAPVLMPDL